MNYFEFNPEVERALDQKEPVVALESTIIAHGMPYPDNLHTALKVEDIVRDHGAIPATIGIVDGVIQVGMNEAQLRHLAKANQVMKVSRRDFPPILARELDGATTVAGTIIVASKVGIDVFVTGGIGGVHRGAEKSFDISADLTELSKSNVAVVSAGAKSILDIGATLEKLETLGIPVLGYRTTEFPAFYSRESEFSINYRVENPEEIAQTIHAKWELPLSGGILIANPVPAENEIKLSRMEKVIDNALAEAERKSITGKELTPFLLDHIVESTDGQSLEANKSLIKNNARLGAKIANNLTALS